MGVTGLRDVIEIEEKQLRQYSDCCCAIDAHNWIYKYMAVQLRYIDKDNYTTTNGVEVPNLPGILRGLPTLLKAGITPVFVFDGHANELKTSEIEARKERAEHAQEKLREAKQRGDIEAIKKYRAQSAQLTQPIIKSSKQLLTQLGIPTVTADGAGEGYAAHLAKTDDRIDAAISDDYDTLLFGSPITIRSVSGSGPVEHVSLQQLRRETSIEHHELVDIAILLGTDYNDGVHGIGPKRAVKKIRNGETAVDVVENRETELTVERVENVRDIYYHPPNGEQPSNTTITPDYNAAIEFLTTEWELRGSSVEEHIDSIKNAEENLS